MRRTCLHLTARPPATVPLRLSILLVGAAISLTTGATLSFQAIRPPERPAIAIPQPQADVIVPKAATRALAVDAGSAARRVSSEDYSQRGVITSPTSSAVSPSAPVFAALVQPVWELAATDKPSAAYELAVPNRTGKPRSTRHVSREVASAKVAAKTVPIAPPKPIAPDVNDLLLQRSNR